MPNYSVRVSKHIADNMLEYTSFISKVSVDAAKRFVLEFEKVIGQLEDNPFQFQIETTFENPAGYRKAVFAKWYKCLFTIEGTTVYLDYIVDCRQDTE